MEAIPTSKSFKQYLIFWTGQMFSLLGSMVVHFVIIWYLTILTKDPLVLALGNFFYLLPMIFTMPFAGVISDRINRKNLILIVDSLQAVATIYLITFLVMGVNSIGLIFLFMGIRSICQAFHQPTVNAIIPTMVPKDKLSRINGLNFLFSGIIQLIGPLLAGFLLVFMTYSQALWIDVITFVIAFIPLALIKIPIIRTKLEKMQNKNSIFGEFKEGLQALRLVPGLLTLLFMAMLLNFLIQPLSTQLPLYALTIHDTTPLEFAFLGLGFQGGLIAGAFLTTVKKQWKHKINLTFGTLMLFMINYALIAFAPYRAFLFLIIITFIMGFVLPIVNTIYQTFMQIKVPHNKLGRVSSVDSSLSMAMSPIGALISGPLALLFGVSNLFFICGLLGVLVLIVLYTFTGIRSVDFDDGIEMKSEIKTTTPGIIE